MTKSKPVLLQPLTSAEVAGLIHVSELFLRDGRNRLADAVASKIVPKVSEVNPPKFDRSGGRLNLDTDEFARRIVHLLGPAFYADEFKEVSRQLWVDLAGGSFCGTRAARMLRKLCRAQTIELVCARTRKKPAFYRVRKRPRSR